MSAKITPRQLEMLHSFATDGEATDFGEFDNAGSLAWHNREQVIDALKHRGLVDADGITASGRALLEGIAA